MPRAEREDKMLEAAGAAFATHGFHDTSMDEIARSAGISKPMLYNYFGSKRGLYVAYVERSGYLLIASMRTAASPDEAPSKRLRAGILAFLTYAEEHGSGWAILHREAIVQGGPLAAEVSELRERVASMLAALFKDEALAHAFVGAGEALASWWLAHPQRPKEEMAQLLMDIAPLSPAPPDHASGRRSSEESSANRRRRRAPRR